MADPSGDSAAPLRRTPLAPAIREAGGRLVPFAGWEMPVQFAGLVQEHRAVRERCGVFDISHMGVLRLRGQGVKDALQALVPSDLFRIGPAEACYTVLLNERGGIRDDLIVYDRGRVQTPQGELDEVVLVINAACADSDTAWIASQLEPAGITIEDRRGDGLLLALQGPEAASQLQALSGADLSGLPRFGHRDLVLAGEATGAAAGAPVFVARTGYTGEDGFELLLERDAGLALWAQLLERGVEPCGLGARDTLRLEAGMPLYGHELVEDTNPFAIGLGRGVNLEGRSFPGSEALARLRDTQPQRVRVGLRLTGKRPAREGCRVFDPPRDQRKLHAVGGRSDRDGDGGPFRCRAGNEARGRHPRQPSAHRGRSPALPFSAAGVLNELPSMGYSRVAAAKPVATVALH
jgi:aminomethyltransferase